MEKSTFTIDLAKKAVTLCHETKTLDGKAIFETTFLMADVTMERMLKRMADAEVISWRARAGIKELTTAEITTKGLLKTTVDCAKTVERVKHVDTPKEKRMKELIAIVQKSPKGSAERTAARQELLAMWDGDDDEEVA